MQQYATVYAAMFSQTGQQSSAHQTLSSRSSSLHSQYTQSLRQQVHWRSDGIMATLAYASPEYELYALFDAMTSKELATKICHRLSVWIKGQQADLFMPL